MKIIRKVNGETMEFELTPEEMDMVSMEFDKADIKEMLDYLEEEINDEYGIDICGLPNEYIDDIVTIYRNKLLDAEENWEFRQDSVREYVENNQNKLLKAAPLKNKILREEQPREIFSDDNITVLWHPNKPDIYGNIATIINNTDKLIVITFGKGVIVQPIEIEAHSTCELPNTMSGIYKAMQAIEEKNIDISRIDTESQKNGIPNKPKNAKSAFERD